MSDLCPFDRHKPSRNSTALSPIERLKSRMGFESQFSPLLSLVFGFAEPSQKPSFLREIRLGIEGRLRVASCRSVRVRIGASRSYSITSSAWTSSNCGTVRPSALAVFRLMTSSNVVGCSNGSSAGFSPFRTLST
jgi:hypothetical protein